MSRVRGLGNTATELAMVALLKQHRIAGWLMVSGLSSGVQILCFGKERCRPIRGWLLLASTSRLQVHLQAENTNRFLAAEVRAECREGSIGNQNPA